VGAANPQRAHEPAMGSDAAPVEPRSKL
jgi:hypothetical protein